VSTTIGSSDVARILGLSPWGTPWETWSRLHGLTSYSSHDTPAQARGRMLEPALLIRYAQEVGVPVMPGPPLGEPGWAGPEPWMHARPDGWVPGGEQMTRPAWLVEAKTARYLDEGHGWGPEGTDQVPQHYLVQCVWQMACCDVDRCDLVAFGMASDDFRIYRIARDVAVERAVVNRCRAWYQRHVEQGEPPGFDGSAAASQALAAQHSRPRQGATVEATDEEQALGPKGAVNAATSSQRLYNKRSRYSTTARNTVDNDSAFPSTCRNQVGDCVTPTFNFFKVEYYFAHKNLLVKGKPQHRTSVFPKGQL